MTGHKLQNSESLKFIFGGNSTVTFLNTESDNRFTFRVKQKKDTSLFFVSVLTSPEIYTYIGTIFNGNFKHGVKSTISKGAQSVRVFSYVLNHLKKESLTEIIEVWHEGKCGKCNRQLTVPVSIASGFGPSCIKMISKAEKRDKFLESILG